MLTQENLDDLRVKGYTIVPGVVPETECDQHMAYYHKWLKSFPEGTFPETNQSLVRKYRVGHMEPTWSVRLRSYPIFAQLWKTEKLHTSFDAVAMGRPPEGGEEEFYSPENAWLHIDHASGRIGIHAYQGSISLEHCDEEDWTFEVVEGSHNVFEEFMDRLQVVRCNSVSSEDLEWLAERGCVRKRIPCPKGAMVLWDSRLIHANARPIKGRKHEDRWRFVVIVCMTPAIWSSEKDVELKVNAYNNLLMTGHLSKGVFVLSSELKHGSPEDPNPLDKLPDIATSDLAKRLSGVLPYEGIDEDKANLPLPKFRERVPLENTEKYDV